MPTKSVSLLTSSRHESHQLRQDTGGGGRRGPLGADAVALVVVEAGLVAEELLADSALPARVIRVGELVPLAGSHLEEGLVARGAVVLLLLQVHLADVPVQPVGRVPKEYILYIYSNLEFFMLI